MRAQVLLDGHDLGGSMAKYAALVIVIVLYVWVIMVTMPYRREVITAQDMNDHFTKLERELAYAKADYDTAKASDPNSEKTLAAAEHLAICHWEKKEFDQAVILVDDVLKKRREMDLNSSYNEKFVSTLLLYGGILRDVANWDSSEAYYLEIYAYDKKFLEKSDPNDLRLARDLNNLGLLTYLRGTSQTDEGARAGFFKQACDYLNQAIKMYQVKLGEGSPSEAISLWNLYFAERDQGNIKVAKSIKKRAEAIDAKLNRPKAP